VLEPYVNSKPARSYANGLLTFAPDFSDRACLKAFAVVENVRHAGNALAPADPGKPGSVVLSLASPYLLTKAKGQAVGADAAEVSIDGGRTFRAADLNDFSALVKGQTAALVKVSFRNPLRALKLEAVVQNNPGALPYLSPGRNRIIVSVADPAALGENKLVVTYGYRLGARTKSFEQFCDQDKEIARQHNAQWSDAVTCVQKSFTARELPATFEIDCPTPKGQYPVYPRMMLLRREVIAPGSRPQPLPAGAVQAKVGPGDELVALPNPFLVGTETPPPGRVRQVKTLRIPLTYVQYVNDKGEVSRQGTLRWPKNRGEEGKVVAGAVVVAGELKELPARGVAAARLLVPVTRGHNKSAGRLGAVLLKKSIQPGQACEMKELTETAGSAIIPQQPEAVPAYHPAKPFPIDLTRAVKSVASGQVAFHGLALRMVPDRGTDDGWTVCCDVSNTDALWLEVDVYTD
jgi:hypothetical protein